MKRLLLAALLPLAAHAQTQSACTEADGQYLSGVVSKKPYFVAASETIDGVQLSHTHLNLLADQDGRTYDVAIDNVFNPTWPKNSKQVPPSLKAITVGNHLSLCGLYYTEGSPGIHWVHDSCGDTSPSNPNGWTEIVTNGTPGANLEASTTYCYLFGE